MNKLLLLICVIFFSLNLQGQNKKYWIKFKDKNNSPYTLSNPSQFLSQRAIDRRTNQGISLKENDIPVTPAYVDSVKSKGAKVFNRSKWFNAVTIQCDSAQLVEIKKLPFILNTLDIGKRLSSSNKTNKFQTESILQEASLKHRNSKIQTFDYGNSYDQIHMLNGEYLHNDGFRGEGMIIAVLDAGFRRVDTLQAFDSLWINNQIIGTWDFVVGDSSVFEDDSHGMHVLSIMGGNVPGELIGTAPKAKYLLLRSENTIGENAVEECNWAAAAEFADSAGADIINSSLGYTDGFDDPSHSHTYTDMDGNTTIVTKAADIAASKGILVVNSAGNEGGGIWHYIGAPADGDSVLAIGAVNPSENKSSFSSFGYSSDGRVKPNVMAMGSSVVIQKTDGSINGNNSNGTSFSGPVIAGMVACLWQANPTKNNMSIFHAVEKSADKYSNPDTAYGYGIPDFQKAREIITGIKTITLEKNKIFNYPNPFEGKGFTLEFNSDTSEDIQIEVFDILGKLVFSVNKRAHQSINKYQVLENNKLRRGIYFLKITSTSLNLTGKLIRE